MYACKIKSRIVRTLDLRTISKLKPRIVQKFEFLYIIQLSGDFLQEGLQSRGPASHPRLLLFDRRVHANDQGPDRGMGNRSTTGLKDQPILLISLGFHLKKNKLDLLLGLILL